MMAKNAQFIINMYYMYLIPHQQKGYRLQLLSTLCCLHCHDNRNLFTVNTLTPSTNWKSVDSTVDSQIFRTVKKLPTSGSRNELYTFTYTTFTQIVHLKVDSTTHISKEHAFFRSHPLIFTCLNTLPAAQSTCFLLQHSHGAHVSFKTTRLSGHASCKDQTNTGNRVSLGEHFATFSPVKIVREN